MGKNILDQYSLLHFGVGIVAYFWGIPLYIWIILNILFEYIENTPFGVQFIDNYITIWPGGKKYPDSFINIISDIVFCIIGWLIAYYITKYYNKIEKKNI